jgi:hypothetical protein
MSKKPTGFDPVEAAKLVASKKTMGEPIPPAEDEPEPLPPAAPAATATAAPAPVVVAHVPSFRVKLADPKKKLKVSMFGQIITLRDGSVVSESSYGPGSIERLLSQGVVLEPVTE